MTARPAEMLLAARALDFLARGPSDAASLIAHVCQLPNPPAFIAEEMAIALFAGRHEFHRGPDGRWYVASHLTREAAPPAYSPYPGLGFPHGGPIVATEGMQPLASMSYVVVDVETTGGQAFAGDRVTEVAAIVVRNGVVDEAYETLVNPERPIPPLITALTNISWSMVRDKPTFRDICEQLLGILEGHVFVAHNAGFDWRFLTAEVRRATGQRLDGRRLCTVRLARRLLPQLRRRSLDHVARYYGVEITSRHRAGGDARATAQILLRLLEDAAEFGVQCWPELEQLLAMPRRRRRRRRSSLPQPVDRDTTA